MGSESGLRFEKARVGRQSHFFLRTKVREVFASGGFHDV